MGELTTPWTGAEPYRKNGQLLLVPVRSEWNGAVAVCHSGHILYGHIHVLGVGEAGCCPDIQGFSTQIGGGVPLRSTGTEAAMLDTPGRIHCGIIDNIESITIKE